MTTKKRSQDDRSERQQIMSMANEALALLESDSTQAQALATQALQRAQEIDTEDIWLAAPALVALGRIYIRSGELNTAARYLLQVTSAEPISSTHPDHTLIDAHYFLGLTYTNLAFYSEALASHQIQYQLAEKLNDRRLMAAALRRIGVANSHMGQYERAIDHYQQSIALYNEVEELGGIAACHNNMSMEYIKLNKPETALQYALLAVEEFEQSTDDAKTNGRIAANINVARCYLQLQDIDNAMLHIERAVELATDMRSDGFMIETLITRGRILHQSGQLEEALESLHKAESKLYDSDSSIHHESLYRTFSEIYESQGNAEQALHYFKLMHNSHVARDDERINARFEYLSTVFETQKAIQEAAIQQQRAEATEQRAARERQYFEQLNQMRDEFLHAATHDLKNPLSTIRIYSDMLRNQVSSELVEFIEKIDMQTVRMSHLIMEILDIARLETGYAIRRSETSLTALLQRLISVHEAEAAQKGITLLLEPSTLQSPLTCSFDPHYLQRAISNLISNALKYSSTGDTVSIEATATADEIMIAVTDTGIGIPPQDLERIFERFYRVHTKNAQHIEGTGLGLAITKTIIEQHGGTIQVKSIPGEGSRFEIRLPT